MAKGHEQWAQSGCGGAGSPPQGQYISDGSTRSMPVCDAPPACSPPAHSFAVAPTVSAPSVEGSDTLPRNRLGARGVRSILGRGL